MMNSLTKPDYFFIFCRRNELEVGKKMVSVVIAYSRSLQSFLSAFTQPKATPFFHSFVVFVWYVMYMQDSELSIAPHMYRYN